MRRAIAGAMAGLALLVAGCTTTPAPAPIKPTASINTSKLRDGDVTMAKLLGADAQRFTGYEHGNNTSGTDGMDSEGEKQFYSIGKLDDLLTSVTPVGTDTPVNRDLVAAEVVWYGDAQTLRTEKEITVSANEQTRYLTNVMQSPDDASKLIVNTGSELQKSYIVLESDVNKTYDRVLSKDEQSGLVQAHLDELVRQDKYVTVNGRMFVEITVENTKGLDSVFVDYTNRNDVEASLNTITQDGKVVVNDLGIKAHTYQIIDANPSFTTEEALRPAPDYAVPKAEPKKERF